MRFPRSLAAPACPCDKAFLSTEALVTGLLLWELYHSGPEKTQSIDLSILKWNAENLKQYREFLSPTRTDSIQSPTDSIVVEVHVELPFPAPGG